MNKKWTVLFTLLIGSFALGPILYLKFRQEKQTQFSQLCIQGPYFFPVEITDFHNEIPCIDVKIEDQTIRLKLDLGSDNPISLPSELIEKLNEKSPVGCTSYYGMRGKKYTSNVYELPKIQIGNIDLFGAKAEELNVEFAEDAILASPDNSSSNSYLGAVGWPLFHNFNLFLDCEDSKIAFCDSLETGSVTSFL